MIKQARNYMVGAMSGAGLLAAGVVAFVLLVSVQVFEDWPVAGLVGGVDETSVSAAEPTAASIGLQGPLIGSGARAAAGPTAGGAGQGDSAGGAAPATTRQEVGETGKQPPGETGAEGAPDGGGSTPTAATGGSSGGTASSAGAGGAAGGNSGSTSSSPSTSAKVTGSVNETVNQVDQTVTGGALNESGVTQVTEEAVNGIAGPESTVGKVVDETVGTVEGILGK